MQRLPYIECYPNGRKGPRAPVCLTNNIRSYPTWIIGDLRYTEVMSVERLAQLSNYTGAPGETRP